MHGGFSRGETLNFMAAIGPDFKAGFVDPAPVSNADVGKTLARVLGLNISAKGKLQGRVIAEAMPGGNVPKSSSGILHGPAPLTASRPCCSIKKRKGRGISTPPAFPSRTMGLYLPTATASR